MKSCRFAPEDFVSSVWEPLPTGPHGPGRCDRYVSLAPTAQMNAHPRRSATDSLCLDPAQAARPDRPCAGVALPWPAGLVTRSVFQPEFLPQRRFELVPTSDSI